MFRFRPHIEHGIYLHFYGMILPEFADHSYLCNDKEIVEMVKQLANLLTSVGVNK